MRPAACNDELRIDAHLNRLNNDGAGVVVDEMLNGLDVVKVTSFEARNERCEGSLILFLHGGTQSAHRPSVEAVGEAHNFVLLWPGLAVLACNFESAFVGLGARVCTSAQQSQHAAEKLQKSEGSSALLKKTFKPEEVREDSASRFGSG